MIKMLERFQSPTTPPELSWEADVRLNLHRSERRAWRVAIAALVCAGLCILALVLLIPLKRTVPYLVAVDKVSGDLSVVPTGQAAVERSWVLDKHWIKQFVMARERYDYPLLQVDYNTVQRFASADPWKQYGKMFEGDGALDKKYGKKLRIEPTIVSIIVNDDHTATVRLETKTVIYPSETVTSRRLIATLRFEYTPLQQGKESDLIENPLGFHVVAYRTDEELFVPQQGELK